MAVLQACYARRADRARSGGRRRRASRPRTSSPDDNLLTSSLVAFIDNEFSQLHAPSRRRLRLVGPPHQRHAGVQRRQYDSTKLAEIRQVRRLGHLRPADRHQVSRRHVAAPGRLSEHREAVGRWRRRPTRRCPTTSWSDVRQPDPGRDRRPCSGSARQPTPEQIRDRMTRLLGGRQARRDQARQARGRGVVRPSSTISWSRAQFYEALADFLVDLPLFPFACIKGPVVRVDAAGDLAGRPRRAGRQAEDVLEPGLAVRRLVDAGRVRHRRRRGDRAHPGDARRSEPADRPARLQRRGDPARC